jgi:hypothetical protein
LGAGERTKRLYHHLVDCFYLFYPGDDSSLLRGRKESDKIIETFDPRTAEEICQIIEHIKQKEASIKHN